LKLSIFIILFQFVIENRNYGVFNKQNINWCRLVGLLIYQMVHVQVYAHSEKI